MPVLQFRGLLDSTASAVDGFQPRNTCNIIWAVAKLGLKEEPALDRCIHHMRQHSDKLECATARTGAVTETYTSIALMPYFAFLCLSLKNDFISVAQEACEGNENCIRWSVARRPMLKPCGSCCNAGKVQKNMYGPPASTADTAAPASHGPCCGLMC